jgi:GT2 family glycosyltransferase
MSTASGTLDISIVIPSYNRGHVVEENVLKCLALRPAPAEIILVDDHSDPDSEEVLRRLSQRHSGIQYIRLPSNGGQAVSRSIGFASSRSKYVVSLDDDSWFLDGDALHRVWNRMESLPRCGILAFQLFSPGLEVKAAEDSMFAVADHLTCGAAYRSDVLRSTGYHLAFLRYVGEESDLSLKVRDAGFDVIQDMNIRVFHDYDPSKRSQTTLDRVCTFGVRNDMLRAVIYFPLYLVPLLLTWKLWSHISFGFARGYVLPTLQGLAGFFRLLPRAVRERKPISRTAARRYLQLRRRPEPFVAR